MAIFATMSAVGRAILAAGLAGTGALCLIYVGLDPQWQHPPASLNAALLAYANGGLLILLSLGLLIPRAQRIAGLALAAFLVMWVLVFSVPRIVAGEEAAWLAPAEILAVASGAWIASGSEQVRRARQVLFGLCLITFGVSHFLYLDFTASMIPGFVPFHLPLAAITGAGHIAAGLSIISGILAWLGSALLAAMFSLFVILLHVPRVLADPASRIEWTMLFHAMALTGAAWLMAGDIWKARAITETRWRQARSPKISRSPPPSCSRDVWRTGMRTLIALSALILIAAAPPALAQMGGGMGMSPSSSGPNPQQAYAAGVAAYNNHNFAEAIRQLRSARSAAPSNGGINYALGLAYIGAGQKPEAREALTRAVHDRNAQPDAYLQLGLVSLELGDRAGASAQQTAVQTQLSHCDAACGDAKRAQWQAAYDQLTRALAPPS